MKLNKLFRACKQKMIWENILKSLLLAAMLSAAGIVSFEIFTKHSQDLPLSFSVH